MLLLKRKLPLCVMDKINFDHLELQLEALLQAHNKLKHDNILLRQKVKKLTQDKSELEERNKKAAAKIRRIISQLRSEMQ